MLKNSLHILYLDQNKWIELAKAIKNPDQYPEHQPLIELVIQNIEKGRLAIPLTFSNIYETWKINNDERRENMAMLQCKLSNGFVFRGRRKRLETEISNVLRRLCDQPQVHIPTDWFLSKFFFEAVSEIDDPKFNLKISSRLREAILNEPGLYLYDYLVSASPEMRAQAVRAYSSSSEGLRRSIEERRMKHRNESAKDKRNFYSAMLTINEIDLINEQIEKFPDVDMSSDRSRKRIIKTIVDETPTLHIERELGIRIEQLNRPIEENDFRDMLTFCAAIPYANELIGENTFVNVSKQSNLDKKFNTRIDTNLLSTIDSLSKLND